MIATRLTAVVLVGMTILIARTAEADSFIFRLHDLQGTPLTPVSGLSHELQIFEQQEGVQLEKFGEIRTIQLRETDRGLGRIFSSTNELSVNVPAGQATQALVFVFRRSDEKRPTATLAFLVMPNSNADGLPRTHQLDVAIPADVRAASAPAKPCPEKRQPKRRCLRRSWR